MALYRTVRTEFWEDRKVIETFTPEDKYFFLWLLTNPSVKQCGIYEIVFKRVEVELGYTRDSIETLLNRFQNVHKVIRYNKDTGEVAIHNWAKHHPSESPKVKACIYKELKNVKDASLIDYVYGISTESVGDGNDIQVEIKHQPIKPETKKVEFDFEAIWKQYPSKVGKPAAQRHFKATVKTDEDFQNIQKALSNYVQCDRVKNNFIQNGSTWFNDWRAWIDPTPQMMKGGNGKQTSNTTQQRAGFQHDTKDVERLRDTETLLRDSDKRRGERS